MIQIVPGDLLELARGRYFDVIAHGCNCFCAMGRGIAGSIQIMFPEAYEADKATTVGDRSKLGTCTYAHVPIGDGHALTVVNAYTQFHWNGDGVEILADYDAIRSCMKWIKQHHHGQRIGLPKIGAGLARGDWDVILRIIQDVLGDESVTVVEYAGKSWE